MSAMPLAAQAPSRSHLVIPVAVIVVLSLIVVPLPTPILDLLITIDLAAAIVILLSAMYVPGPTQFSAFPSILLLMTLFRLALNIASTRLILLNGDSGAHAAGAVIGAFGNFVVGGSFVVGAVIFLVLLVVQFVVISHGSTRISEVTARFTLDAMPGKQMAIDADLNAGLITEREAVARREAIQKESDFFGAMDGSVRFTQRDAIASLVITLINIVAGLAIGILQKGMEAGVALETYAVLTIGDGLVSSIPALLIAVAGGIITTRAAAEGSLGDTVVGQLMMSARPLRIAAGTLFALALVPGMPKIAFFVLAGAIFAGSRIAAAREEESQHVEEVEEVKEPPSPEEEVEPLLGIDPLCVEVGYDLIDAVGADRSGGILDKIKGLRTQMASDLGIVLPPVRVRDNLQLQQDSYQILLRGVKIAEARIPRQRFLALDPGGAAPIAGEKTKDPAFGLPAVWVPLDQTDQARAAGYTVVDPPSVLSTHLMEVIHRHAADLLGREDTARLIDHLQKTHPKAVAELVPDRLTVGEVQRVLQGLLREGVSVRDLPLIAEALADAALASRDTAFLVESVRRALARTITSPLLAGNELPIVSLAPELEDELAQSLGIGEENQGPGLAPGRARELVTRISTAVAGAGGQAAIVVGPRVRPPLAQMLRPHLPHTPVLSTLEIPAEVRIRIVATVS